MTDLDTRIGERIRELRDAQSVPQTELANYLNITFQQVQKYEQGINHVTAGRLAHIAKFFGVPILSFYQQDASSSGAGRGKRAVALEAECEALTEDYRRIQTPAARQQVRDLARLLAATTTVRA